MELSRSICNKRVIIALVIKVVLIFLGIDSWCGLPNEPDSPTGRLKICSLERYKE